MMGWWGVQSLHRSIAQTLHPAVWLLIVALAALSAPRGLAPLALLAGALYALAGLLLVPHLWRRVLAFRTLPRPDPPKSG